MYFSRRIDFPAKLFLVVFFFAFGSVRSTLVVQNSTSTVSLYAPTLLFPGNRYLPLPLTTELYYERSNPLPKAAEIATLYAGRIVFIKSWDDPPESELFPWLEAACKTAAALVLPYGVDDSGLGFVEFVVPSVSKINVACPALTISWSSSDKAVSMFGNGSVLNVTLTGDDGPTPVRQWLFSWWFWLCSLILATSSCGIACLAVMRAVDYFRYSYNGKISVLLFCIIFEFCGCFNRFLYWSIDAMGARQLTTQQGGGAWRTTSFPFTLASTLMITFFWHESLQRTTLTVSMNVDRFKIPCYLLIALSFAIEIIFDTVRLVKHNVGNAVRSINSIFYIIVALGLAIFYIITAIRILFALKRAAPASHASGERSKGEDSRRSKLKSTTIKLLASAVCLALIVIVGPISLLPSLARAPMMSIGFIFFYLVIHFLLNMKALTTLLAINRSKSNQSRSSKSSVINSVDSRWTNRATQPNYDTPQ